MATLAALADTLRGQAAVQLTPAVFGEAPSALAGLGLAALDIGQASVTFDGTTLTLSGVASLLGLTAVPIAVRATGDSDRHVAITLTLPGDWRFPTSFATLPPSYRAAAGRVGLVSLQPSLLADLAFDSASIVAQNLAANGLPAGLGFTGVLHDAGVLDWLAAPLGIGVTPTLAGPITLAAAGAAPSLALAIAAPGASLSVGSFLKVEGVSAGLVTMPDEDGVATTALQLAGSVAIGTTAPLVAQISGRAFPGSKVLTLEADFAPGALSLARGLDALAEFAGLPVADLPLPTGALRDLSLTELTVALDWSAPRVQMLQFAVATDHAWPIAGDVSVSALQLGWRVLYPFDAAVRDISASLIGTLSLGAHDPILFDVAAYAHSGFRVIGALRAGSTIALGDLVAKAIGTDPSHLPKLDVTALEISADTAGSFTLDATLAAWGLTIPGLTLTLDQVRGTFERTAAGSSGSIAALFTLGTVQLWVSAAVPAPGAAFQFDGETYGDAQSIPLGDVAHGLVRTFGASLPAGLTEWLDDIVLTKVSVTFDDQTGNFAFAAKGTLQLSDTKAGIELDITATRDPAKATEAYTIAVAGAVTIGTRSFGLLFAAMPTGSLLAAHYANASGHAIDVKGLVSDASPTMGALVPAGITIGVKDVVLLVSKTDAATGLAFGLALDASLDLADLPLVGEALPAEARLSVSNLHFTYSSSVIAAATVTALAPALAKTGVSLPATGLQQGVNLSADLDIAGVDQALLLGVPAAPAAAAPPPGPPAVLGAAASSPMSGAKYFPIQKQLGPIDFKRVGVQYANNALLFLIDASIAIGPLTFSMDGLGIGSSVTHFAPVFALSGLGLAYDQPPVEIAGALLHLPDTQLGSDTKFQFDGDLVVKAGTYSLAAIGSYAQLKSGDPSMFLFAQASTPLGGPPAFFVTGLMGGFGYNRLLQLPGQDEVLAFPLLQLASAGKQDPIAVLDILEGRAPAAKPRKWITPAPGSDWAAVGLTFTSFELVQSQALLVIDFGNDFQAALLGLSTMRLPQPADNGESYVYVELELEAVLKPQQGYFGLTAILSANSYVLTPDCHLTGGFAFSIWYGPSDTAGQFVLTLGGYHPAFTPPPYFPRVPRLGFNWAVSDDVTIKGEAYFALTTSVAMGGGGLEILFHDGDLQAWFTAQADFLISWHPFFFLADIDVSIGVSYRLNLLFCHKTISVSVGASVHMWGPPTGGTVHVHLWVVSFSVDFGADQSSAADAALDWGAFKNLLPHADRVVLITASAGLTTTLPAAVASDPPVWVVRAGSFAFNTRSIIPASAVQYRDTTLRQAPAKLSIRPMNLAATVDSVHGLVVSREVPQPVGQARKWAPIDAVGWTIAPQTGTVPQSLWGTPPSSFSQIPAVPSADVLDGQLVGYSVSAPAAAIGATRGLIELKQLVEDVVTQGPAPISLGVAASASHAAKAVPTSIADIAHCATGRAADSRSALFAVLAAASSAGAPVCRGSDGSLAVLAGKAAHLFSDPPMELA